MSYDTKRDDVVWVWFRLPPLDGLFARMVAEAAELLLQDDVLGSERQALMPAQFEQCICLFIGASHLKNATCSSTQQKKGRCMPSNVNVPLWACRKFKQSGPFEVKRGRQHIDYLAAKMAPLTHL